MGGEWWFDFKMDKKDSFDLKQYQSLLPVLRAEFEPKFPKEENGGEFQAFWCSAEDVPPQDNIYARFTFHCTKPGNWQNRHLVWYLFWDPTTMPLEQWESKLHGRTGPWYGLARDLQGKVARAFPNHFDYENDYDNEYGNGYGEEVDYHEGSDHDLTACDKECGYCGKCPY